MFIDVTRNSAYAHLGDAWLRYQSARILQRHLQFGLRGRLDVDALLAPAARLRLGISTTGDRASTMAGSR